MNVYAVARVIIRIEHNRLNGKVSFHYQAGEVSKPPIPLQRGIFLSPCHGTGILAGYHPDQRTPPGWKT